MNERKVLYGTPSKLYVIRYWACPNCLSHASSSHLYCQLSRDLGSKPCLASASVVALRATMRMAIRKRFQ